MPVAGRPQVLRPIGPDQQRDHEEGKTGHGEGLGGFHWRGGLGCCTEVRHVWRFGLSRVRWPAMSPAVQGNFSPGGAMTSRRRCLAVAAVLLALPPAAVAQTNYGSVAPPVPNGPP